uniref:Exportin-2 n=2 Tax=Meloidogyne incognita group TaxID=654580 RepID=A0A914KZT5_MELIC
MSNQVATEQIVGLLQATLSPESVKQAQDGLTQQAVIPGYARVLLKILCDANYPNHIRNIAAISLKNFVKMNWSGEGDIPISDDEREELRNALLEIMFQVPQFLRLLVTEIVCQVSKYDFPERWPRLVQLLAENLSKATDFDQLVVSLGTLEQMVSRYRHEMRSDSLWREIIFVVQNVAEPLTQLFSKMQFYLPDQEGGTQLSPTDRISWLQIVLELTRIYHSLISQDLPEYFEDNLTPWMEGFLQMLSLKLPEQNSQLTTDPTEHDKLCTEICEIATLFSQRFEDCFVPYTQRFMGTVWNLLVFADAKIRFDALVNSALGFLAAICQRPQYVPYFRDEGVLKAICDNVIVKNLTLRPEDFEIFENEPFEFLKRDIEGSDLETRRRGAFEFVRALCKHFDNELCALLSNVIQDFLEKYKQNPAQNFVYKDLVYFLVSALASKGSTTRSGATETRQLIDLNHFYQQNVRPDLLFGSINELPILRCDALKYLVLFRNQLSTDQIIECFLGENCQFETSIFRLLSSNHFILHHYVAYAIERLILMRVQNSKDLLFTASNFQLSLVIDRLFNCLNSPQGYETHYIMKALMRLFVVMDDELSRSSAHIYLGKLSQIVADAIRVPKNPVLVHFLFESICVIIRKAYVKVEGGVDKYIIPMVESIIQNDVAEFKPYAFQLIALLLDQCQQEREKNVTVSQDAYIAFFPSLLRPDFWARSANVPALILVFESFIRCLPQLPFGSEYSDQVLAIFQRLIASKAYDQQGFRLANALLPHLDTYERMTSSAVFLAMLNRMHQNKTAKFSKQFTIFIFRYSAIKGGLALANSLEQIQTGIYNMIVERILLVELKGMPQTTTYDEKRIIVIGAARLISETIQVLGNNYSLIIEVIVNLLEAFEHKPKSLDTEVPEDGEVNDMEYNDPYCKLMNAQHNEPFAAEVINIKKHFAQAVFMATQSNPESLGCLNARLLSCLRAYSAMI